MYSKHLAKSMMYWVLAVLQSMRNLKLKLERKKPTDHAQNELTQSGIVQ